MAGYKAPGKGTPREERQFDKTYLAESGHGRLVHRDYGAHFFRWGHATRFTTNKTILDVGCGPEFQMGRMCAMHGSMSHKPIKYVGADMNKIRKKSKSKMMYFFDEFDFTTRYDEITEIHGLFDVVTCFEVIEHMHVSDGINLLNAMRACLAPGGRLLLSTPILGSRMARNHIHEYGIDELRDQINDCGFEIVQRFGTFGNIPKLRKVASPVQAEIMEKLSAYYSNEIISCFLAPLYPDDCRNNMWVCKLKEDE